MEWMVNFSKSFLQTFQHMWMNPFYLAGLLIILLQYRKQIQLERKFFHTKLHSWLSNSWTTILWGWIYGLIVSFVFLFIHLEFKMEWLILLWIISIGLSFIRRSYFCLAYSVGLLGIGQAIISYFSFSSSVTWINDIVTLIVDVDMFSLLVLAGVLHLVEGILLSNMSARRSTPVYTKGKRGYVIGGFQTEAMWIIPLFLVVPLDTRMPFLFSSNSIFSYDFSSELGFIAFPVMISFSYFSLARLPEIKARQSGTFMFLFGSVLLVITSLSLYVDIFVYVGIVTSLFLHEALTKLSLYTEKRKPPFFSNQPDGLTVLDVIPQSTAQKLGIQSGEIIHRVNGIRLLGRQDMYLAMQRNSAFCKMEIINLEGETKFVNTPLYDGEHHELGILFAPDPYSKQYISLRHASLWNYFRKS